MPKKSGFQIRIAAWIFLFGLLVGSAPASSYYFLPHVVDGTMGNETNVTRIVFYNPSEAVNHLTLTLYGDNGGAAAIGLTSAERPSVKGLYSSLSLTLQPKETVTLLSAGGASLTAGWAQVSSDQPLTVSSGYIFLKNGILQNDLTVAPAQAENAFHLEALFGDAEPAAGLSTNYAVALVNPSAVAATVWLQLQDMLGKTVSSASLTLPSKGHKALFLTEAFSDFLPKFYDAKYAEAHSFHGHVSVRSNANIAMIALRSLNFIYSAVPAVSVLSARTENLQEMEPNGNFFVSNTLNSAPAIVSGTLRSTGSEEDFDYYKILIPAGKTLRVNPVAQLAGSDARMTVELWVEHSNLPTVSRSLNESHAFMDVVDSSGIRRTIDPIAFSYTTGPAAVCYVVVRGTASSGSASDSYRLFLDLK